VIATAVDGRARGVSKRAVSDSTIDAAALQQEAASIVVADCQPLFRSAVRTVLAHETGRTVVEASNLSELLSVAATGVGVALVDVQLGPFGGVEAIARLRAATATRAVLWGVRADEDIVLSALEAGADGYLEKDIAPDALVRALCGLSDGHMPLPRDLVPHLVDRLRRLKDRDTARERAGALSERENEVLRLVADGWSNQQIAVELSISEFTVKRHMQNILAKLNEPSRRHAAVLYHAAHSSMVAADPLAPTSSRVTS
jgi:two-component system, NarL family, nitrate/nitrite response regulator NarL